MNMRTLATSVCVLGYSIALQGYDGSKSGYMIAAHSDPFVTSQPQVRMAHHNIRPAQASLS